MTFVDIDRGDRTDRGRRGLSGSLCSLTVKTG